MMRVNICLYFVINVVKASYPLVVCTSSAPFAVWRRTIYLHHHHHHRESAPNKGFGGQSMRIAFGGERGELDNIRCIFRGCATLHICVILVGLVTAADQLFVFCRFPFKPLLISFGCTCMCAVHSLRTYEAPTG